MHGYELKARLDELSGHVRRVSDGALYPAIARLEEKGLLRRHEETGASASRRHVLTITEAGRAELHRRLREPKEAEICDQVRFFALLAFLGQLPDPADQVRVLRQRLRFLELPSTLFYRTIRPQRPDGQVDRFRHGMALVAKAAGTAERDWLRKTIAELEAAQPRRP